MFDCGQFRPETDEMYRARSPKVETDHISRSRKTLCFLEVGEPNLRFRVYPNNGTGLALHFSGRVFF